MYENTILVLSNNPSYSPMLYFDFAEDLSQPKDYTDVSDTIDMYLSLTSDINIVMEKFDNLEFLSMKFNELREKELDNKITSLEKNLLYDIIEKRILEFPNPYWPINHKKTEKIKNKYLLLEKEFDKKYKIKKRNRLFNIMFSWLG